MPRDRAGRGGVAGIREQDVGQRRVVAADELDQPQPERALDVERQPADQLAATPGNVHGQLSVAVEPPPLGQPGVQHERAGAGHRPDHGIPLAADRLEILDPPERADGQSGSLPGRGLRAHGRFASHMVQYTGGTAKARPRRRVSLDRLQRRQYPRIRVLGRHRRRRLQGEGGTCCKAGAPFRCAWRGRSAGRRGARGLGGGDADIRQARPGAASADRDRNAAGGRPDLHRHLRAARPRAVPLQLGDQEPGRRDGPVQGSERPAPRCRLSGLAATRRRCPTRTSCRPAAPPRT